MPPPPPSDDLFPSSVDTDTSRRSNMNTTNTGGPLISASTTDPPSNLSFPPPPPLTAALPLSSTSSSYDQITTPSSSVPSSLNGFQAVMVMKNGNGKGKSGGGGPSTNGFTSSSSSSFNVVDDADEVESFGGGASRKVVKVTPPGTTIYEDSTIDREEFVRLAIQIFKDIGYNESANVLEAESGYSLETARVSDFRAAVLGGSWNKVADMLSSMGVLSRDLQGARYLVSQQHYLELLEQRLTSRALNILRTELAPNSTNSDKLHVLSSLMMCSDPNDLRERAKWDGAEGLSRRKLLRELQTYIPTNTMIPERRLKTLIDHAHLYQRSICMYHDPRAPFSLYTDHECSRAGFPTLTTNILEHDNEVWILAWSHDGRYLASGGKDRKATVWQIGPESSSGRDCVVVQVLNHAYCVTTLAWSLDDKYLITGAEQHLMMWDVQTGLMRADMKGHKQGVSAIAVMPDGRGFISGGMDMEILFWDLNGNQTDEWTSPSMRVLDLALTPDGRTLVIAAAVDRNHDGSDPSAPEQGFVSTREGARDARSSASSSNGAIHHGPEYEDEGGMPMRRRILTYNVHTKEEVFKLPLPKEITSVCISSDSRYALINHAPDDLLLLDLEKHRIARKYTGQQQREDVIRGCFGGIDEDFILSGSEDSNVYIWRKETGTLVEKLSGHGKGNVNAVAWNPKEVGMFASCSDDATIRIWEAPPPGMDDLIAIGTDYDASKVQSPTRSHSRQLRGASFDAGSAYPRLLR